MKNLQITLDSTCDLNKEQIEKFDLKLIPFYVLVDGTDKLDGVEVSGADIVEYVKTSGNLPRTSAPSVEAYTEFFKEALNNAETVLHFSISSEFSVANSNAISASKAFDGRVKIIDTRSLSTGISLVMLNALDMLSANTPLDEVVQKCNEVAKCTQASFVVESLTMLHKGGRCSGLAAFLGKTLGLRPSLLVKNGKLGANKKYLLSKYDVIVRKYVLDTLKQFPDIDKTRCFVTHTPTRPELIKTVIDIAKEHFDEVIETDAGATICSHCGENTIGILYTCNSPLA